MMSKKKFMARAAAAALLICLTTACFLLINGVNHSFRKGILFGDEGGIGSFDGLERKNQGRDAALFSVREATAGNGMEYVPVNGVYVGKNFGDISVDLVRGDWFGVSDIARENNSAVIDSRLAVDLFFSVDVVGREITVNGRTFRIAGVCEFPLKFVREFSGNGNPPVFLAYTAEEDLRADYLYVSSQDGKTLYPEEQRRYLSETLEINAAALQATDFSVKLEMINTIPFAFARIFIAGTLTLIAAFTANLAVNTPWEGKKRSQIAVRILVIFGSLGAFAFLTVLLCRLPRIPVEYLPGDSIFNLERYFEYYVGEVQQSNASLFNYAGRMLLTSFNLLFLACVAALAAASALLISVFKGCWRYTIEEK